MESLRDNLGWIIFGGVALTLAIRFIKKKYTNINQKSGDKSQNIASGRDTNIKN